MKYRDYLDVETWKPTVKKQRAFFKEESFQNEKEFRILVELNEPTELKGINLTSLVPLHLTTGIFTLHPKDYVDQIMRIKSLAKVDFNYKFELSRLTIPEYDD